ncbi:hypothetical protein TCAL_07136 [Tigriopus californicus]|uniref:HTH La-type RNA-binding domain-containing protein n=1 Tax=Tigriopus californicus TaxID=6832 RepID=A0A553NCS4_TIGCA|nr:la protein homolog isoform X2 [Tigriopus californicus]TRY63244.1 hypothetical protein TCAL_07136 [Tigriopus californicus]
MTSIQSSESRSSDKDLSPAIIVTRTSGRQMIQNWALTNKIRALMRDQSLHRKLPGTILDLPNGHKDLGVNTNELSKDTENLDSSTIHQASQRMSQVEKDLSALEQKVIRQMEHYFGDYNLPRDRFMRQVMEEHDGWIPMSVMMTFKRLAALSQDPYFIMRSTVKSENALIEVDFDNERVRRSPLNSCPSDLTHEQKEEIQARTIHVRGFPKTASVDELLNFFEVEAKNVCMVRRKLDRKPIGDVRECENQVKVEAKSPNDEDSRFSGSVFVTFGTRHAAQDFLAQKVDFQGRTLISKWEKDYYRRRTQFNDTFDEETIQRTVWVDGFDNQLLSADDLAEFFSQFKGAETIKKRKIRECQEESWKFIGSVFVTFENQESAKAFLALSNLNYKGDSLRAKFKLDFFKDRKIFLRQLNEYLLSADNNNLFNV